MHKEYPYLQDSYVYYTDQEHYRRSLLKDIEQQVNQKQYVKITLLDWEENPIKAIEGEISSGSISKVADSPVRRTANLSCAVDANSYSVEDGKADFAINKKVFIEIGVKNETPHYPDYPIFWFPEGVFFIASFSINSSSNSALNLSISLKDKMAMLNGDVGGILPTTVIFDSMDTQLPSGEYIEKKVLIYNIIKELVNHYGGESLTRIVIEGIPLRIRRIMKWMGDTELYLYVLNEPVEVDSGNLESYQYSLTELSNTFFTKTNTFVKGDDVGYIMDDFVITGELTGGPGESVTSILDKIKNILGNYEYFYDVFGTFHFREIKNYYVTTQARTLLDEMAENDYLVEVNNERSIFTFDNVNLLTSINVTPQYENIKNDYIVEGHTQNDNGVSYSIRYHLAIDKKPRPIGIDNRTSVYELLNYDEDINNLQTKITSLQSNLKIQKDLLKYIREEDERYNNIINEINKIQADLNQTLNDLEIMINANHKIFNQNSNKNIYKNYYGVYPTESDIFVINDYNYSVQDMINYNNNITTIYGIESPDDFVLTDLTVQNLPAILIFYKHPRNGAITAAYAANVSELPEIGNFNLIYHEIDENYNDNTINKFFYWDGTMYQQLTPLAIYTSEDAAHQYYATDWRTKLYLDGLRGVINGTDKGYYYEELAAFWPQVYDLQNQCFYGEQDSDSVQFKTLCAGTYYLDFLDSLSTSLGEWSIDNIGRRTDIVANDEINCLFQPEIPNIIILPATSNIINKDSYNALEKEKNLYELRAEAQKNYYPWTQVEDEIYNNLLTGGYRNAAFDQIKYELYLHTRYQKSISITSIPVFYLEPNSRVTINDPTTNTYGDFVIKSINLTLGPGANMSVTCNETAERF